MRMLLKFIIVCFIVGGFISFGVYWCKPVGIQEVAVEMMFDDDVLTECIINGKVFSITESY